MLAGAALSTGGETRGREVRAPTVPAAVPHAQFAWDSPSLHLLSGHNYKYSPFCSYRCPAPNDFYDRSCMGRSSCKPESLSFLPPSCPLSVQLWLSSSASRCRPWPGTSLLTRPSPGRFQTTAVPWHTVIRSTQAPDFPP